MIKYSLRAINSAGECYLHTVEVTGSNPVSPTHSFQISDPRFQIELESTFFGRPIASSRLLDRCRAIFREPFRSRRRKYSENSSPKHYGLFATGVPRQILPPTNFGPR